MNEIQMGNREREGKKAGGSGEGNEELEDNIKGQKERERNGRKET